MKDHIPSERDRADGQRRSEFREELRSLLNRYNMESGGDTPDRILADYLCACLAAYDDAVKARDGWFAFEPWPPQGEKP